MRNPTRTSRAALGALLVAGVVAAVAVVGPRVGADDAGSATTTTSAVPPAEATTTEPPAPTTEPSTTVPPTTVSPTTPSTAAPVDPAADGTLEPGEQGPEVLALQQRLSELGFWLGEPDSGYGKLTQQAVMAFQKANGLERDGRAGPATLGALATAQRPTARSAADGIEIDLARQILLVVQGGEVLWVINTSTGTKATPTPPGDFVVDRQIDGLRRAPLGNLYRPKYFNAGIAVHGSPSIPGYPASHGCARVSNPAMDHLWASGVLEVGTPVRVH